jgi:hypothetical protein
MSRANPAVSDMRLKIDDRAFPETLDHALVAGMSPALPRGSATARQRDSERLGSAWPTAARGPGPSRGFGWGQDLALNAERFR